MLLTTTAFWLVRIENVAEVLTAIYETGRFPVSAFGTVGLSTGITADLPPTGRWSSPPPP